MTHTQQCRTAAHLREPACKISRRSARTASALDTKTEHVVFGTKTTCSSE